MRTLTEQKLAEIFRAVLNLAPGAEVTAIRQEHQPGWDSLAHVTLVAAMESEFGLAIDAGDSIELTSYEAAARYLEERGL